MPKSLSLSANAICLLGFAANIYAQDRPTRPPLPQPELAAFAATFDLLMTTHAKSLDGRTLLLSAIRGMVQGAEVDDDEYLTEEEFTEFQQGTKPGLASVGASLQRRGPAYVLTPYIGGPAHLAGVRAGDELRVVDGRKVGNENQRMLASLLSGEPGSAAKLTLFRPATGGEISITVQRAPFVPARPTLTRVREKYAVLAIPDFRATTAAQLSELLRSAGAERPLLGIVLDIRSNPGGLLDASIAVCSLFLPSGTLVATSKGQSLDSNKSFKTTSSDTAPLFAKDVPLVVLVDEGTSSAAEILAAAFRDNQRARIVGRPTVGRGNIQTVRRLPGLGAIKYTTAFWMSPAGRPIHMHPLVPDLMTTTTDREEQLSIALDELATTR